MEIDLQADNCIIADYESLTMQSNSISPEIKVERMWKASLAGSVI